MDACISSTAVMACLPQIELAKRLLSEFHSLNQRERKSLRLQPIEKALKQAARASPVPGDSQRQLTSLEANRLSLLSNELFSPGFLREQGNGELAAERFRYASSM